MFMNLHLELHDCHYYQCPCFGNDFDITVFIYHHHPHCNCHCYHRCHYLYVFPSIFEWDLTNGPLSKLVELLDTQVFSGSVQWVLLEMSWIFMLKHSQHMGVSKNGGTPKSSILTGFSIINYKPSIFGVALFLGNIHIVIPLCGNRITILLGKKSPHPARMPQSKRTAMVLLSIGLGCSGGLSEAKVEVRCLALGGSWFGCFQK